MERERWRERERERERDKNKRKKKKKGEKGRVFTRAATGSSGIDPRMALSALFTDSLILCLARYSAGSTPLRDTFDPGEEEEEEGRGKFWARSRFASWAIPSSGVP